MVDFTNFTRTVTAAVGALVLSTLFVTAAVGPAATAGNAPGDAYAAVQTQVSVQEQQA
jgi:hypothetical protein